MLTERVPSACTATGAEPTSSISCNKSQPRAGIADIPNQRAATIADVGKRKVSRACSPHDPGLEPGDMRGRLFPDVALRAHPGYGAGTNVTTCAVVTRRSRTSPATVVG